MSKRTRFIAEAAIIAALYTALTLFTAPISFGGIQLRVSEALTLMPCLSIASIPGLFVGCVLSNLVAGNGLLDVVFGSLATLAAALLTYSWRRNPPLAALPPVLINAVVVALILNAVLQLPLLFTMMTVGIGQALACYGLGLPLYGLLRRRLGHLWPQADR